MRLHMTPPRIFAAISLVLIIAIVVATSITQASFFRQAIIDRESSIIYDLVRVDVLEKRELQMLSPSDLQRYSTAAARKNLDFSFRGLKYLSGAVLIKVFNSDRVIVWSDQTSLIGTGLTSNPADLKKALSGEVRAVFNRADLGRSLDNSSRFDGVIEFYVPFSLEQGGGAPPVTGAVAIYRNPEDLNQTIRRGLFLLWGVTGVGGLVLFFALYRLFVTVYRRQRETEFQFVKFTTEHERMMQIEKLSALGQMVSEIAHQLNSPLVGVINLAELAERNADNPERVKGLLADVRKAGDHCRGFVQRMLMINKIARSEPQPTDIGALVQDTIEFFHQSLGGRPAVSFSAPAQPVTAVVDPVLIRHALFNLIHNAAQADPVGPVRVALADEARDGRPGCRISVSDSGSGMAPEVQAKIFTPFFTTRPGGTGLGLSVAQHVAVLHGGAIQAENIADGGARFSIWIPIHRPIDETKDPGR